MEISFNSGWLTGKYKWVALIFVAMPLFYVIMMFSPLVPCGSRDDVFGYMHEIMALALGSFLFTWGFKALRKKRVIENTPTSKVRSAAMGLCEISGQAREKAPLISPYSKTPCVFYRFKLERETRDSKGRAHWRTEREGTSPNYFYIEDETGRMLVDPVNAEDMLVKDYEHIEGLMPRRRYTEWYLKPGDYVYVLGSVKKFKDAAAQRREKLNDRLRALKADKEKMKQFDTDGDGQISAEEWDAACAQVEQQLLQEEVAKPSEEDDVVLACGDVEPTFIISDRDERDVARGYGWKSIGGVTGASVILAATLMSVVTRLGIVPLFKIPWHQFYR